LGIIPNDFMKKLFSTMNERLKAENMISQVMNKSIKKFKEIWLQAAFTTLSRFVKTLGESKLNSNMKLR
jgi:hypothetical protein